MTRSFQFRELSLYGAQDQHTYRFGPGVNLILGPVGSGKTSLLELLKYTLGGSATLSPAVQESVVSTAITIEFDNRSLVLTRQIGSSTIGAHAPDGAFLGAYANAAGRPQQPVSDVLLEALQIPALRVPRSRRRPTGASSRLTFFDIYAYLYLSQTEIDRSVVSHLDSYREPKRRATFELLYGLSNAALLDLEVQRGELREALSNERRRADDIRSFLAAADQPDVDQLRRERERVVASLEAATSRRRSLQADARSTTRSADPIRERLGRLEALQDLDNKKLEELLSSAGQLRALAAQLELDSQRITKSLVAGRVFSGLEFTVCPRCMQSLSPGRVNEGGCYLCLQPESVDDLQTRLEDEQRRVEQQHEETLELLDEDEAESVAIRTSIDDRGDQIRLARTELDQATVDYVSPRFEEIQEAGAEVGRLEARLAALDRVSHLWERYGAIEVNAREIDGRVNVLDARITEIRASLADGIHRVTTLSELFAETLQQFQLPWLETAAIDVDTYLPIINGRSFEELLSGGMKTLVNDAYHLAALRYALVYADSLMPLLQVVDSPRKNLGSGPDDRVLSENLYRRIRVLQDSFNDGFQMIVADNDAPALAQEFRTISLGYDHPGVPFAIHPGPEHVQSIGSESPDQ